MEENVIETTPKPNPLTTVTPLSKALALILFIALPFVGFYLGTGFGSSTTHLETDQQPLSSSSSQSLSEPNPQTPPEVKLLTTPITIKRWQTYRNGRVRFEYPETWKAKIDETGQDKDTFSETALDVMFTTDILDERGEPRYGGFSLVAYKNPQGLTLEDWIRNKLDDKEKILRLVSPDFRLQGAEEILRVTNEENFYAKKSMVVYDHTDYFIKTRSGIYDFTWYYQDATYYMPSIENQFFPRFVFIN